MFKRDQPHHRHVDWARSATDLSLPMHLQALEPRVLLDAAAAASGTLTAASGAGVTVTDSGTASILLSGTLADVNAMLASAAAPVFVPVPTTNGPVSLTMLTDDAGNTGIGGALTDADTATIQVVGVNDPPVNTLPATGWTTSEDTAIALSGLSVADVDAAAGLITVQLSVPTGTLVAADGTGVTVANGGTASLLLTGTLADINAYLASAQAPVYVPVPDANGTVTLTMHTNDGGNTGTGGPLTDTDTALITITPVNDAPVAADDGPVATAPNTPATGNVITGTPAGAGADTDVDLDPLSVTQFAVDTNGDGIPETFAAGTTASLASSTGRAIGTLVVNADGSFVFTPAPAYDGPVPQASYTVSDGTLSDTATLSFAAVPNTPPTPLNDVVATDEDTPLVVPAAAGLLANDSDADHDALVVTGFSVAGMQGPFAAGASASIPQVGVLTIRADGSYSFVPAPDYNGAVPLVTYAVSDGTSAATATLTLSVNPVNDAPQVGTEGVAAVPGGGSIHVDAGSGLLADATDVDGDHLSITDFTVDGLPGPIPAGTPANIPGVGVLTIFPDGSYSFVPDSGFSGSLPKTTFTVSDGEGGSATGNLALNVLPELGTPAPQLPDNLVYRDFVFVDVPGGNGLNGPAIPPALGNPGGAVLSAVQSLGSTSDSTFLDSDNVIMAAVNNVESLNGSDLSSTDQALGASAGFTAVSNASRGMGASDWVHARLPDGNRPDALGSVSSGSSLRLLAAPGRTDVVLEMQSLNRQIWIGVEDPRDASRSPVRRVEVTLADGRPLPPWIRVDAGGLILIEAPAGTETIGLRITVVRQNGETRTHTVDVDTRADELHERAGTTRQPANGRRAEAAHPAYPGDFSAQLAQASRRPATVDVALLEALT
ncbi:Ig-like domain-containing protein [Variovorax sp. dw_954]|uniref:cadherin-like domain-containing protein n=1 Tax=Variovorax sp. dw_954 TaxID=2720078 RepID=UPI001BD59853|nr:Ig-like domain-containing protein [Variovorax sp. dw_954]